jgi:hypothetical protein
MNVRLAKETKAINEREKYIVKVYKEFLGILTIFMKAKVPKSLVKESGLRKGIKKGEKDAGSSDEDKDMKDEDAVVNSSDEEQEEVNEEVKLLERTYSKLRRLSAKSFCHFLENLSHFNHRDIVLRNVISRLSCHDVVTRKYC